MITSNEKTSFELFLSPEVCALLNTLATLLDGHVEFFTQDGKVLKRGSDASITPYCRLMQNELFGLAACQALDSQKRDECARLNRAISYICHAGLNEIIAPVNLHGELIGFITFGQFRTTNQIPQCLKNHEQISAFMALPYRPSAQTESLCHLITLMVDYMTTKEFININGGLDFLKITKYIDKYYATNVTLPDLASHLNCSESYISHYLRQQYNTTFKRMLIEKRLAVADELLKSNPRLSIGDVASKVGFDRQYFSRIYRIYRGTSPKNIRK